MTPISSSHHKRWQTDNREGDNTEHHIRRHMSLDMLEGQSSQNMTAYAAMMMMMMMLDLFWAHFVTCVGRDLEKNLTISTSKNHVNVKCRYRSISLVSTK